MEKKLKLLLNKEKTLQPPTFKKNKKPLNKSVLYTTFPFLIVNKMSKKNVVFLGVSLFFVILLALSTFALSPNQATDFVTKTNNFLIDGEQAVILSPQSMISYNKNSYWIVAIFNGSSPSLYIPINNKEEKVASGAIEVRELIKTEIILSQMNELKNSLPIGNWPFSHPTKTFFYDLERAFSDLVPSVVTAQTEMESISGTESIVATIKEIKSDLDALASESEALALKIEEARLFEENYFISPDTNKTSKYEKYYSDYFTNIEEYKSNYNSIDSKISVLKQAIAVFPSTEMTSNQKDFFIKALTLPNETAKLPSFFSQTDQIKTAAESRFNSAKNIENLVLNLETRQMMNDAWQSIYGYDDKIFKANNNFSSLSGAVETILSDEFVELWEDQDSVTALKTNWAQAKSKYDNAVYDKAKNFAVSAEKNVLSILDKGIVEKEDTNTQDLIIVLIIILVVVIIGVFVFEKFFHKKGLTEDEEYDDEKFK